MDEIDKMCLAYLVPGIVIFVVMDIVLIILFIK